ncbi:MAG TPA: hypothetical protein VI279_13720 [Rhodocyclaceae bacterium]
MAGTLTPSIRVGLLLLGAALAAAATLAAAQGAADPTRPAIGAGAAEAAATQDPAAATAGLQSVFIRKGGKSGALINGEYVEQGGRVGESVLLKVGENFVVLKGPGGKEVLRLTPGVDVRAAGGTGRAVQPMDVPAPEKKTKGKRQ